MTDRHLPAFDTTPIAVWEGASWSTPRLALGLSAVALATGLVMNQTESGRLQAAIGFGIFALAFVLVVRAFARPRAWVGADGVAFANSTRGFLSFADIVRLERDGSSVGTTYRLAWLVLRSGARLALTATWTGKRRRSPRSVRAASHLRFVSGETHARDPAHRANCAEPR